MSDWWVHAMRSVILSDCVVNLGLPVTCVQLGVLVVVLNKQVLNPTLPESEKNTDLFRLLTAVKISLKVWTDCDKKISVWKSLFLQHIINKWLTVTYNRTVKLSVAWILLSVIVVTVHNIPFCQGSALVR